MHTAMKITTLLLALAPAMASAAPHDAEVAAVRALYARYAAESVFDDAGGPTLATAPRAVLQQHFTDELAQLWLRDRDCVARTRAICRIDFAPLWDSQDPVGSTVKLNWDDSGQVIAQLNRRGGSPRTLAFSMALKNGHWRVADIDFGPGRTSLRRLLEAPVPR